MSGIAYGIVDILLWGFIATLTMTAILFSSQQLGWSRLNMPFLLGTMVTGDRHVANIIGFAIYLLGGLIFAFFYYLAFSIAGVFGWRAGIVAGLIQGSLLLTAVLPMLPYMHPRVASEYDGASSRRRLEPPGFLALHYGYRTPLIALIAHAVYGGILGYGLAGIG